MKKREEKNVVETKTKTKMVFESNEVKTIRKLKKRFGVSRTTVFIIHIAIVIESVYWANSNEKEILPKYLRRTVSVLMKFKLKSKTRNY